jgi:hypothetical protein
MDTRVYRGAEIDTDHYLLISKIKIPNINVTTKKNKKLPTEEKINIQLLEEESIRTLYHQRLNQKLRGRTGDIHEDW